jgi:hypothetical protein
MSSSETKFTITNNNKKVIVNKLYCLADADGKLLPEYGVLPYFKIMTAYLRPRLKNDQDEGSTRSIVNNFRSRGYKVVRVKITIEKFRK